MPLTSPALACFTFDNMGEAAEVGAGQLSGRLVDRAHPSLAVGYPAIFEMLERRGVRATFFVEGWNGVHHPEAVAEIVARGHEVGTHGWVHESWATLDADSERDLATRATEAIERAAGSRPRGFRAPGGAIGANTERVLLDLGYAYDASLGDGMKIRRLPQGLVQVPFVWPSVDGYHYLRDEPASPESVREAWLEALRRVASRGGLFVTICHAFISGIDGRRLAALEAVIDAAVGDEGVAVRTVGEVAARFGATA